MKRASILAIGLFLGSSVTYLSAGQNSFAVYGMGTRSCGLWTEAREGAKKDDSDVRALQFEMWADGYLSAYNLLLRTKEPDVSPENDGSLK